MSDMEIITLNGLAKIISDHVRKDYDSVIAITSMFEGDGKSTLALQLGLAIDPNFKLERNVLFAPTVEQMKNLIFSLPKYSVINADEAIKILYKLNWADKLSIFLNQLYALCRKENLITILCMPRFRDFNEFFRNHKIKIWIHILERGRAVIFYKDWNMFARDPWWMDENMKKLEISKKKFKKVIDYNIDEKINIVAKTHNFVGILEFSDIPPELKTEYMRMRDLEKYNDIDMGEKQSLENMKLFATAGEIINKPEGFTKIYAGELIVDLDAIMNTYSVGRGRASRIKKIAEKALRAKIILTDSNNNINTHNQPKTLDIQS